MTTILERINSAVKRLPPEQAEAVAKALEPDDLGERRAEIIAQIRKSEEESREQLVPLDAAVAAAVTKRDKAQAELHAANDAVQRAIGARHGVTQARDHLRKVAIRELRAVTPPALAEAQREGRRRANEMQFRALPEGYDAREVHAANQRLHQLEDQLLTLDELEASIAECLAAMPPFEGDRR